MITAVGISCSRCPLPYRHSPPFCISSISPTELTALRSSYAVIWQSSPIALILLGGPENRIWIGGAYACVGLPAPCRTAAHALGVSRRWWVSDRIE